MKSLPPRLLTISLASLAGATIGPIAALTRIGSRLAVALLALVLCIGSPSCNALFRADYPAEVATARAAELKQLEAIEANTNAVLAFVTDPAKRDILLLSFEEQWAQYRRLYDATSLLLNAPPVFTQSREDKMFELFRLFLERQQKKPSSEK